MPRIPKEQKYVALQAKVESKIKELHEKVPDIIGYKIKPVTVKFDLHTKRVGGSALSNNVTGRHEIRLHPTALLEYGDQYIEDTVVHEFAHIVTAHYDWHARAHGPEWKMIMTRLGAEPSRCHDWDLDKCLRKHGKVFGIKPPKERKQRTIDYTCECGTKHEIGIRTHNKIKLGATYVCKLCNSNLKEKV